MTNCYVFFMGIIACALICDVVSEETSRNGTNQLHQILENLQNGEVLKKIQETFQDINTSSLQQKAKEFQETVQPVLDRLQNATQPFLQEIRTNIFSSNSSSDFVNSFKNGINPLIQALNTSASKFTNN